MIVLDAGVLIAQVESRDVHHGEAVEVFAELGRVRRRASTVTVAEVLVGYAAGDRLRDGEATLRWLQISEVPLGPGASARLALVRATTRLRLPDCCVLLAAEDARAEAVATFDDRLAAAAQDLGFRVVPDAWRPVPRP